MTWPGVNTSCDRPPVLLVVLKKQNIYFYVLSHVLLLKYHRLAHHHFVGLCGLEPIVFGYYWPPVTGYFFLKIYVTNADVTSGLHLMTSSAAFWQGILQDSGLPHDVTSRYPSARSCQAWEQAIMHTSDQQCIKESNLTPLDPLSFFTANSTNLPVLLVVLVIAPEGCLTCFPSIHAGQWGISMVLDNNPCAIIPSQPLLAKNWICLNSWCLSLQCSLNQSFWLSVMFPVVIIFHPCLQECLSIFHRKGTI